MICTILCIIALIAATAMCFIISDNNDKSMKIVNAPTYIVLNRWYDNNELPLNINKRTDKEITYHTSLPKVKPIGAKLIIKTKNMKVNAYTNGKSLTEKSTNQYEGYGEQYTIISLDDMGKNKEIFLHLIPLTEKNSCICDSIYITTQNELFLNLLQKSASAIVIISICIILLVYCFIKGLKNIFKFKTYLYTDLIIMDMIFITFYNSSLPFLTANNGTFAYIAKHIFAMTFPLFLSFFIKEIVKCKSIIFDIYEISICTFCLIRLVLFANYFIPLDKFNSINFVLITVLILITLLTEKTKVKKSQK